MAIQLPAEIKLPMELNRPEAHTGTHPPPATAALSPNLPPIEFRQERRKKDRRRQQVEVSEDRRQGSRRHKKAPPPRMKTLVQRQGSLQLEDIDATSGRKINIKV